MTPQMLVWALMIAGYIFAGIGWALFLLTVIDDWHP